MLLTNLFTLILIIAMIAAWGGPLVGVDIFNNESGSALDKSFLPGAPSYDAIPVVPEEESQRDSNTQEEKQGKESDEFYQCVGKCVDVHKKDLNECKELCE